MRTRVGLVPNADHEIRKTRKKTQQVQTRIQQDFIAKEKHENIMTKKILKIGVE
jgi:hypothetical protein